MNYIKQVNKFYELALINPLNANSQSLYFALLNINNKCNWLKRFTVANTTLMMFTGLNISALQRARNNLVQKGLIKYQKGRSNNAGFYEIIEFEQQNEQHGEQQNEQQNEQQTNITTNTLNKQNKTKQNDKKENKKEKATELDEVLNEKIVNEDLRNSFKDFIKMRKAIKKPLTTKGLELCISRLFKLSEDVNEQLMIINNSIVNSWQGIFPVNAEQKKELVAKIQKEYKVSTISETDYHRQGGKRYE